MRFFVCSIFTMLIASAGGCKGYGLDEKPYTDDGTQWGQAVNGLQVGLARRNFEAGKAPGIDQTYFLVQLRNVSGKPLSILAPTAMGGVIPEKRAGDESVSVKLIYDSAAGVKTAVFTPPNKPVVQVMEVGKDYNLQVSLSPAKFGLDQFVPGRLSAAYSNAQETIKYDTMGEQSVTGLWTGDARSGTVKLDGTPTTQEAKDPEPKSDKREDAK
jgi:hypothetical protein